MSLFVSYFEAVIKADEDIKSKTSAIIKALKNIDADDLLDLLQDLKLPNPKNADIQMNPKVFFTKTRKDINSALVEGKISDKKIISVFNSLKKDGFIKE